MVRNAMGSIKMFVKLSYFSGYHGTQILSKAGSNPRDHLI